MTGSAPPSPARRVARAGWAVLGLGAVAIGSVGIVVPGLPTTVFFIVAAWCFARSSPRLERWVLGLPRLGPLVRDHRAGLGMPQRAKVFAVTSLVVMVGVSVALADGTLVRAAIVAAALVGVAWILGRVPTRERVLARRAAAGAVTPDHGVERDARGEPTWSGG